MQNITLPLRSGFCTIEPDKITVIVLFGWKIVVDRPKQEITQQLCAFGIPIPLLKLKYKFSDVYRTGRVRTDTRSPLLHDSSGSGTDPSSGTDGFKSTYDLILFLKSGGSIKVANMTNWYEAPKTGVPPVILAGLIIGQ